MNTVKAKTYFNFAKRNGTLIIGTDNILAKRGIKLIVVSGELSENGKSKLREKAKRENIKLLELAAANLIEITSNNSIMAIGFKDRNLTDAFLMSVNEK